MNANILIRFSSSLIWLVPCFIFYQELQFVSFVKMTINVLLYLHDDSLGYYIYVVDLILTGRVVC